MKSTVHWEQYIEARRLEEQWISAEIQLEDVATDQLYRLYKFEDIYPPEELCPDMLRACSRVLSTRRRDERDRINLEDFEEDE